MTKKRRQYSAHYKFRVALEATKGDRTISELSSETGVHPTQIGAWKRQLVDGGAEIFNDNSRQREQVQAAPETELYEQIGRLKMELEWLKKKLLLSIDAKRSMIEPDHPNLSIRRQCELVGLNRASYYYQSATESPLNLELMRCIDEQYIRTPFYGWPKMTAHLRRLGYQINHKRVQRLMRLMGLQAIYPKRRTTVFDPEHRIYPYLLRGVKIVRPNQVWSSDITYVPMSRGFMYLTAIIDWYSRYVVTWQLSNTLDGHFCREALNKALDAGQPEIFNTDQGTQFTARAFTSILESAGISISMDGRGRAHDNIFIERLWRTVKYEDIYLKEYGLVPALMTGLGEYFIFYNQERLHQSLGYRTPAEVYGSC